MPKVEMKKAPPDYQLGGAFFGFYKFSLLAVPKQTELRKIHLSSTVFVL